MKTATIDQSRIRVGDVLQINETDQRPAWRGAFMVITEIRAWGVVGFVHVIETHEQMGQAFTRQEWSTVDYIGHAVLVPQEVFNFPERQRARTGGALR